MSLVAGPLGLGEVRLLEPQVHADDRGFFMEVWNRTSFAGLTGLDVDFVQDNHSRSVRGVVRGLHYQLPPSAQSKLVRVVRGAVFDVVVDVRRSSPTFRGWLGVELSEDNKQQLWIPEGFAHGFMVLGDVAEVLYKATDYYAPECTRTVRWNDPHIGIDWPANGAPVLSATDAAAPPLADADLFD